MKRYEFSENELSPVAFDVYSNSSFVFGKENGVFFVSDDERDRVVAIGYLDAVNEFLESFAKED